MSSYTDKLKVYPLDTPPDRGWVLDRDFTYYTGGGDSFDIIVPEGFITNFASVPRILWPVFPAYGRYGRASVIHDYLYASQTLSRREADRIFFEAMGVSNVNTLTQYTLYLTVRLVGWVPWFMHKIAAKNSTRT